MRNPHEDLYRREPIIHAASPAVYLYAFLIFQAWMRTETKREAVEKIAHPHAPCSQGLKRPGRRQNIHWPSDTGKLKHRKNHVVGVSRSFARHKGLSRQRLLQGRETVEKGTQEPRALRRDNFKWRSECGFSRCAKIGPIPRIEAGEKIGDDHPPHGRQENVIAPDADELCRAASNTSAEERRRRLEIVLKITSNRPATANDPAVVFQNGN